MPTKYARYGKRPLDVVLSSLGLLLFFPLFAIVSLCIKLDSPGPVYFRQQRIGRNGELFVLFKFRSMKVLDKPGECRFHPGDESRTTRIGKILRKSKIDELPQLYNVLRGEMSIVGPRPEVPQYRSLYVGNFANVLSLKPGITDLASIKYRNEEELLRRSPDPEKMYREVILPDKLKLGLKYKEMINIKTDLNIIIATVGKILKIPF